MEDGLAGCDHLGIGAYRLAGVQVAVIVGEIAARYFKPDLVPDLEQVARWKHRDRVSRAETTT